MSHFTLFPHTLANPTFVHFASIMSTSTAAHGPLPKIPEGSGLLQLGALVFDNADLLDIMGPMRIFGEESNRLNIKINFISSTLEPIRTSQQVKITPDYTLDNAPKMDLFFIPGGTNLPGFKSVSFSSSAQSQ